MPRTKANSDDGLSAAGTPKRSRAASSAKTAAAKQSRRDAWKKQDDITFSLDIGTRTVIGVLGQRRDEQYHLIDAISEPHTQRAMIDGQIEDIAQVAKIVKKVKEKLEERQKIRLSKVAIAAAGRALRTQHVRVDIDISAQDVITEDMVRSFEVEAISQAQSLLDEEALKENQVISFYCVGSSVVNYYLDNYPIKSFVGHKGRTATVDLIAAFLPSLVVESLYAVMDMNHLDVCSLTLEPIAAMNVIVPPETRLINIALIDIGAGTSDIAISKNGSIVAYAMATTAGDEITEEIIRKYLVDFDTAEALKLSLADNEESVSYKDILGFEYHVPREEFLDSISPAIDLLANTICENILEINGGKPAAVFVVGGGSKIPTLTQRMARRLDIPENRIALGGYTPLKALCMNNVPISGPEFVTPIGIGMTSTFQRGYDFSTIMLNDKKVRVFNQKRITILDLLGLAGYKAANVLGRSGRNLTFTLNGQPQFLKGEVATPGSITVNDMPATIGTVVTQGDKVKLIPATNGLSAEMTVNALAGELSSESICLDDVSYPLGVSVMVNGKFAQGDYKILNFDNVQVFDVCNVATLRELLSDEYSERVFYTTDGTLLTEDSVIAADTTLHSGEAPEGYWEQYKKLPSVSSGTKNNPPPEWDMDDDFDAPEEQDMEALENTSPEEHSNMEPGGFYNMEDSIHVTLNGQTVSIPKHTDGSPNLFAELAQYSNLDTEHPQGNGVIVLTLNGHSSNYANVIHDGDTAEIRWGGV